MLARKVLGFVVLVLLNAAPIVAANQQEPTAAPSIPQAESPDTPPRTPPDQALEQTATGAPVVSTSVVRMPAFTDDPLAAGTVCRMVHVSELRSAVNDLRASQGLSQFSFTDPLGVGLPIKAANIATLRSALASTRQSMNLGPITYTDSSLTARSTTVKAAHIRELRNAIVTSWCSLCDDGNACTSDQCGASTGCINRDLRFPVIVPGGQTRYSWQTSDGHVSTYAGAACVPWAGWYPSYQVQEPRTNYCGPSAGMNLLTWYKGYDADPAALYLRLGSEMRTNNWDSPLDKVTACACACSSVFSGGLCPACLCPPPDCLGTCYALADHFLQLGTLPDDMVKALAKNTPAGYQLFHSRGNPGIARFEAILRKGDPIVILINRLPYYLHWALVTGTYDVNGTVMVRFANKDPLSWSAFVSEWAFAGMSGVLNELCVSKGVRPYIWMHYEKTRILSGGQEILAGQENAIYSTDGRFTLLLDIVGHLVLSPTPLGEAPSYWHSNNALINNPKKAVMQTDGNLVIYDTYGRAVWSTGTNGHAGAYLALQNDGNLVIYASDRRTPLWATNTCCH